MATTHTDGKQRVRTSAPWKDEALLAVAVAGLAGSVYLLLDRVFDDNDAVVIGVPVLMGGVAFAMALKAWRLFRIRHWAAGKAGLASDLGAIVGSAARRHGIETEQRAVGRLRLHSGWSAQANVAYGHGDIDLVILAPDGTAFAVEIKSYSGLHRRRGLFGLGRPVLVKKNGREPDTDPVEQTIREAKALAATGRYERVIPVLWVPNGSARTFIHGGVRVVNGGGWRLRRAIGAGWW